MDADSNNDRDNDRLIKLVLTEKDVAKIVHQMKHEMNMKSVKENAGKNFTVLFGELKPKLSGETPNGTIYRISIRPNSIDLMCAVPTTHEFDFDIIELPQCWPNRVWSVAITHGENNGYLCAIDWEENYDIDLCKFIPHIKTKIDEYNQHLKSS